MIDADTGIYETLAGDATLQALAPNGVWPAKAPEGVEPPVIVFRPLPVGKDVYTLKQRVWSQLEYDIKAVVKGHDKTVAQQIADRIDALLNDKPSVIPNGRGAYLRRIGSIDYIEEALGADYLHVGGRYAVFLY